jgi:hypothetical protein
LERTIDVPCGVCGHTVVVIGPGTGPHVASLRCIDCDHHRGWLPRTITEFLLASISRSGWPDEAITISGSMPTSYWGMAAHQISNTGSAALPARDPGCFEWAAEQETENDEI